MTDQKVSRVPFVVHKKPYCAWEWQAERHNIRFLRSVDAGYFRFVAEQNCRLLETSEHQRAAIAIRVAYHHALETLFALVCAVIQAPECIPAWLLKYQTKDLRSLVNDISNGTPILHRHKPPVITWATLTDIVTKFDACELDLSQFRIAYAELFMRLAHDFTGPLETAEYNSIKHGFRATAGGFRLEAGPEDTEGTPPPSDKMQTILHSTYGTMFLAEKPLKNSLPEEPGKRDPNFQLLTKCLNWSPQATADKTKLAVMVIQNLVSYARSLNGDRGEDVTFFCLEDFQLFAKPWMEDNYASIGFDVPIDASACPQVSTAWIMTKYERNLPS